MAKQLQTFSLWPLLYKEEFNAKDSEFLKEMCAGARSFIFSNSLSESFSGKRLSGGFNAPLDLSFSACAFEAISEQISMIALLPNGEEGIVLSSDWIVIREITPGIYDYISFCTIKEDGKIIGGPGLIAIKSSDESAYAGNLRTILWAICKRCIDFLHRKDVNIGSSIQRKQKVRINGENEFLGPRRIVWVAPKAESEKMTTKEGKKIDWSHRWEVRGHWRKVRFIGKDREGNYGIRNLTWVKNHEKGLENVPAIIKTRIRA